MPGQKTRTISTRTAALAVKALERWRRVVAVDAHLYKLHDADYPASENAAKLYDQIEEAIHELRRGTTGLAGNDPEGT